MSLKNSIQSNSNIIQQPTEPKETKVDTKEDAKPKNNPKPIETKPVKPVISNENNKESEIIQKKKEEPKAAPVEGNF